MLTLSEYMDTSLMGRKEVVIHTPSRFVLKNNQDLIEVAVFRPKDDFAIQLQVSRCQGNSNDRLVKTFKEQIEKQLKPGFLDIDFADPVAIDDPLRMEGWLNKSLMGKVEDKGYVIIRFKTE